MCDVAQIDSERSSYPRTCQADATPLMQQHHVTCRSGRLLGIDINLKPNYNWCVFTDQIQNNMVLNIY